MATAMRLAAFHSVSSVPALGCFGAYEFAHALEGRVNYLVPWK